MEQKGSFITGCWLEAGIISKVASDLTGVGWGVKTAVESPVYSTSISRGQFKDLIRAGS